MKDDTKTILVVEDDDALRETLTDTLCDEGFKVASAVDGQDALDWLSTAACIPNLILMDLLMPNVDGWQLWERLCANEHWQRIPVIVLSSALHTRRWPTTDLPAGQMRKPPDLGQMLDLLHRLTVPAPTVA